MHRFAIGCGCLMLLVACSSTKEICDDGIDNDDNGKIDCADPGCGIGAACAAHGLTCASDQTCSACSGNGGSPETAESTCGDGIDNDCDGLVACADPDCQPRGTSPGGLCDAAGHRCGAPDFAGHSSCGSGGSTPGSSALGAVRFVGSDYYVLGSRGSGYQEKARLTFQVTASDNLPYRAGQKVTFTHAPEGGSFIGTAPSCTTGTAPICTWDGATDSEGKAQVLLTSGSRFAFLSVKAEVTVGEESRHLVAGGFPVVGAKPNGARLSLDCDRHNVPALTHHDCLYSHYCGALGTVPCTVKMADRFGIAIGVPTLVGFRAEAGVVPPATVSVAFDVSRPASEQQELGHARGYLEVCNSSLPFDVAPFPGERSNVIDWGCGTRTANPRDGLVTLVAYVEGEEGFVDLNLNGQYDPGEPFVDVGEPFVDLDDDGKWSPGEWFLDVNGDGQYSGPNGRWDADTVIWTQTRVLYTGYPATGRDASGNEIYSRFFTSGAPPAPTPPAPPFSVRAGPPPTSVEYGVFLTDQNFNPLTSIATYSVAPRVGNVSASLFGPLHTVDSMGAQLRQLYCDAPQAPANCHDGPAETACSTSPCYVQWDLGSFIYGNPGTVTITGARPGPDVVDLATTIEGVTAYLSIAGQCLP